MSFPVTRGELGLFLLFVRLYIGFVKGISDGLSRDWMGEEWINVFGHLCCILGSASGDLFDDSIFISSRELSRVACWMALLVWECFFCQRSNL